MKPVNTKSFNDANSSGLITWTGDCIPCLNIKTGHNLNVVMTIIAEKVCELVNPLDLSTLTLQCALDIFNKEEPTNRTIHNVLQLLIDNECGLKELIDNLQAQVDGLSEHNFILDLKCLKQLDSYGNPLEYTVQSVCQQFINEICNLKQEVAGLSGDIILIKNDIKTIKHDMPSGDEVNVTTCISTNKPVSQALVELGTNYCDFKTIVGSASQIQTALAKQSSVMNTLMSTVTGWINTPVNIAQGLNNVYLMIDNIIPRTASNEACCGSNCDDIKIGFISDIEGDTIILRFTSGAGTFIPQGFVDNGSILTITDELGHSNSVHINITQNGQTDTIDLSMFTTGTILDFNIDLKMINGSQICQKCINKNVKYVNSGCCVITATNDVTIVYSTPINNTLA